MSGRFVGKLAGFAAADRRRCTVEYIVVAVVEAVTVLVGCKLSDRYYCRPAGIELMAAVAAHTNQRMLIGIPVDIGWFAVEDNTDSLALLVLEHIDSSVEY